jgi:hypothetical protein
MIFTKPAALVVDKTFIALLSKKAAATVSFH